MGQVWQVTVLRFSLEPPSFRRGPVRGPDENGDASPTHWWRSMRWLVPERFRRQGRMWYIQPHSTASLRPSEGAGHRGRAGSVRVGAGIVRIGVLRQATLSYSHNLTGCSCPVGQVTHCWRNAALAMQAPTHRGGAMLRLRCSLLPQGDAAVHNSEEPSRRRCFTRNGARECPKAATLLVLAHAKLKAVMKVHGRVLRPCSIFEVARLQEHQVAIKRAGTVCPRHIFRVHAGQDQRVRMADSRAGRSSSTNE